MNAFLLRLAASLAALAASLAGAFNHDTIVAPVGTGRFTIACSNIAQDAGAIAQANVSAEEFWEGKTIDGRSLYITQVLQQPSSALRYGVAVPNDRSLYPATAGATVDHVAIVCYPTSPANTDPDYLLPTTGSRVPRMQPANTAPRLINQAEYAAAYGLTSSLFGPARVPLVIFSHGLSGSPISPSHLDALVSLASQGYMVAAVFHGDPRFTRVKLEDLGDLVFLLTQYDRFAEMQLMRPLALKALVDVLLQHPGFGPGIDPERIGAFGASMGGQAVANLVGARLTTSLDGRCSATAQDPRIKAAVGLVTYAGQSFLPAFCEGQAGASGVNRPYLAMGGTLDTTAPISRLRQAVGQFQSSRFLVEMNIPHQYLAEYRGDVFTWTTNFLNGYMQVPEDPGAMGRFIRMGGVSGGPQDRLTLDVHVPFPPQGVESRALEFYHPALRHYFLAAGQDEIDILLNGPGGWLHTGHSFKVFRTIPPDTFSVVAPVCRFYGAPAGGPNSHFFTASASECDIVKRSPGWFYEGIGFHARPVDGSGRCPDGWLSVNRAYNQGAARNDSNHRFMTSDSEWRLMETQGWALEGVVMCALP